MYARARVHPRLDRINGDKVAALFAQLRREAAQGGMPMTVRHLESMLRQSEAHAKMHLREYVTDEDINVAIRVTLNTFIASQKYAVAQRLKRSFARYIALKSDEQALLLFMLQGPSPSPPLPSSISTLLMLTFVQASLRSSSMFRELSPEKFESLVLIWRHGLLSTTSRPPPSPPSTPPRPLLSRDTCSTVMTWSSGSRNEIQNNWNLIHLDCLRPAGVLGPELFMFGLLMVPVLLFGSTRQ